MEKLYHVLNYLKINVLHYSTLVDNNETVGRMSAMHDEVYR